MKPEDVWTDLVEKKAPSTANLELEGKDIPAKRVVQVDSYFVIDLTTANKTIKMGYRKAEKDIVLKREAAGASAYGIYLNRPLILADGERLKAIVESPTTNDECVLIAKGIYLC